MQSQKYIFIQHDCANKKERDVSSYRAASIELQTMNHNTIWLCAFVGQFFSKEMSTLKHSACIM